MKSFFDKYNPVAIISIILGIIILCVTKYPSIFNGVGAGFLASGIFNLFKFYIKFGTEKNYIQIGKKDENKK